MSQAAAISMNDSRFAPAPGAAGPAKLVSPPAPSGQRPGLSLVRLVRLEMKLSRRTRILSTGLLMIATSFALSMLVVAINSL